MDLPVVTRGDYGETRICVSHMGYFCADLEATTPLVDGTKTLKELILSVCLFLYTYNNTFFMYTSTSVNICIEQVLFH